MYFLSYTSIEYAKNNVDSFSTECVRQSLLLEQRANHLHNCAIISLEHTILLRRICDCKFSLYAFILTKIVKLARGVLFVAITS